MERAAMNSKSCWFFECMLILMGAPMVEQRSLEPGPLPGRSVHCVLRAYPVRIPSLPITLTTGSSVIVSSPASRRAPICRLVAQGALPPASSSPPAGRSRITRRSSGPQSAFIDTKVRTESLDFLDEPKLRTGKHMQSDRQCT